MTLPNFLSIIAGFRLHMLTLHAHVDNTQGPWATRVRSAPVWSGEHCSTLHPLS